MPVLRQRLLRLTVPVVLGIGVALDGAGHFIPNDRPDLVVDVIRRMVADARRP